MSPWGDLLDEPVLVLTADQDWAPAWATRALLEVAAAAGAPLHLFVTNACPSLEAPPGELSLGVHPNFRRDSTHGTTEDEVIDHVRALVPAATSFRTHGFVEGTATLDRLRERGMRADSNLLCWLQDDLPPILHGTGLLRVPVWFEDDVLLRFSPETLELGPVLGALERPGLKVVNVHPLLVAANVASAEDYRVRRTRLHGAREPLEGPGRGLGRTLHELLEAVAGRGLRWQRFEDVVDRALAAVRARPDGSPYGWPGPITSHGPG